MIRAFVAAVVAAHACGVVAYEIDTHSRITQAAYVSSTLDSEATQVRLGLRKNRIRTANVQSANEPVRLNLGLKYYDPVKAGDPERYATDYDALNSWVMKAYKAPQPQRRWAFSAFDGRDEPYFPVDWMARGAVREDDTKAIFALKAQYWDGERNAAQSLDANPLLNRFCNHFYDPVADKALDLGINWQALVACSQSEVFGSAPKWALGAVNNDGSGSMHAGRQNGFALPDAREAMWRALTGTNHQKWELPT